MDEILEALRSDGWHLKDIEGLAQSKNHNVRELVTAALDRDLAEIGEKYILESIKDDLLVGPCVLQINKIRNISAPKENEHSNFAPRMLRITFTDGSTTINGIECERIEQISMKTPPGTKVKIIGSVVVMNGLLQLQPSCIKVLGGKVERLFVKWKIALDAGGLSRSGIAAEGGPPPFVAFGKRVNNRTKYKEGTKSLANGKKSGDSTPSEFDEQRKAAIAEVAKAPPMDKNFSSDSRPNFGKRPESATKKPVPTSNRQSTGFRKSEEPRKDNRLCRELSTTSGENVHQKTVNEFVQMGFKYKDAVLCLRKSNNDFDMAMDLLVAMSEDNNYNQNETDGYSGHRGKIGRGRGRSNAGRGRGRGRGTRDIEDETPQASNQATLFDFLNSKMSNVLIHDQEDENLKGHENYSDRYTKHDSTWDAGTSRSGDYQNRFHLGRGDGRRNDPRGNYRNRASNRTTHNERRQEREQADNFYAPRPRKGQDANYNEGFQAREQGPHGYGQRPRRGQDSNRRYQRPQGGRGQRGRNSDASRDNTHPDSGRHRISNQSRGRDDDQTHLTFSRGQSDRESVAQARKSYPQNESKHFTSRFNKSQVTENANRDLKQSRGKNGEEKILNGQEQMRSQNKKDLPFPDVTINPPPAQRGPTTFGGPSMPHNEGARPTQTSFGERQSDDPQVHVTIPQWQIGSYCFAKYWEDSQYYRAVITDLHPTAPTAVVQFTDFGNYEEVQLFDLKLPVASHQHPRGAQSVNNYPQAQGYKYARKPTKPGMDIYVPPRNRNTT